MVTIKSLIKRKFKTEYFPENACVVSSEKQKKVQHISIDSNEEIVVTIDNEPKTDKVDCVVFTDKRIIIVKDDIVNSVYYSEIEFLELPAQKMQNSIYNHEDYKMNRSDKANLHIFGGKIQQIRIIYGGIYLLATLLNNPIIKKIV